MNQYKIGDSGPHNMLISSDRKVYGIDFDEITTNDKILGRFIPNTWLVHLDKIKKIDDEIIMKHKINLDDLRCY